MKKKQGNEISSVTATSRKDRSHDEYAWDAVAVWRTRLDNAVAECAARKVSDATVDADNDTDDHYISRLAQLELEWRESVAVRGKFKDTKAEHAKRENYFRTRWTKHRGFYDLFFSMSRCMSYGLYPPPEILLAICSLYEDYLAAAGKMTAETAFFGRPTKKLGNHAARTASEIESSWLLLEFLANRQQMKSDVDAAEKLILTHQLTVDPETLARRLKALRKRSEK
jgi:hypothetical protein